MAKRHGRVFEGLYLDIYRHMEKREFTHAQICAFIDSKSFKVLARIAHCIVRQKIIATHNYCERINGRVFVARIPGSLVAI